MQIWLHGGGDVFVCHDIMEAKTHLLELGGSQLLQASTLTAHQLDFHILAQMSVLVCVWYAILQFRSPSASPKCVCVCVCVCVCKQPKTHLIHL